MSNPFQLKFTLKQHTPIIHFQHAQVGATLRATEVKPKLDRFIINLLEGKTYDEKVVEAQKRGWIIGQHNALNYKMRIEDQNHKKIVVGNRMLGGRPSQKKALEEEGYECIEFSPYFAQEKEIGELFVNDKYRENDRTINSFRVAEDFNEKIGKIKTLGIFVNDDINIRIICLNEKLREEIRNILPSFFVSHNFGTRQSKGFGCFLPSNIKDQEIIDILKKQSDVKGIFRVSNTENFYSKFKKIVEDYSLLKRGKSYNGYEKSQLWQYLCSTKEINWEKRVIKQHIKRNDINLFNELKYDRKNIIHSKGRYVDGFDNDVEQFYVRAVLGLAELYEFVLQDDTRLKVKIEDSLKVSDNKKMKEKGIDRFMSPIRYLITDSSIFAIIYDIPEELHTYFDGGKKTRLIRFTIDHLASNKSFDLPIPNNFDVKSFFESKAGYGRNLKKP